MVSVAGLSKDPEVKRLAEKVMNLQMFDHIIGSKEQRYQRPTFSPRVPCTEVRFSSFFPVDLLLWL